jgi:branched-chain amino acid transport system permease protein
LRATFDLPIASIIIAINVRVAGQATPPATVPTARGGTNDRARHDRSIATLLDKDPGRRPASGFAVRCHGPAMSPELAHILQLVVNGISIGAIYALIALGLVMTYRATEVLNFAHGDVLMASAFVGWALIQVVGLPFWAAVPLTMLIAAVFCYVLDARVIRLIAGQPQFAGVMLTVALAFMIRGGVAMAFGPTSRTYSTPWTGHETHIGGVVIADLNLAIIATSLIVTALLFLFLRKTSIGIAVQAASQNQLAAYLCGIRVKRLNSLVWALAGALAAVCGLLLAPLALVDITLWMVMLKALAALVLGGFGSIPGAIVGGVVIGLIEQFAGVYLPDGSRDLVASLVLIGVLVIAPRGLLGEAHGRRV